VAKLPLSQDAKRIYLRLIRYAKPYWPMFLLGVFGNAVFATTDAGFVWFVRNFLKDAFVERTRTCSSGCRLALSYCSCCAESAIFSRPIAPPR
jgi:ABC-type multidrug transport system fused ATPase/permease subunit